MRTDTHMEEIYDFMERPPCAEDLKDWAFRRNDADPWNFGRNIKMRCFNFKLPIEFYEDPEPGVVPDKYRHRQFRRSADDVNGF